MSLIDEALKRARHEAARQDEAKRGAARHEGPRPVPNFYARKSERNPLWMGVGLGVLAAVVVGGTVFFVFRGRERTRAGAPTVVGSTSLSSSEGTASDLANGLAPRPADGSLGAASRASQASQASQPVSAEPAAVAALSAQSPAVASSTRGSGANSSQSVQVPGDGTNPTPGVKVPGDGTNSMPPAFTGASGASKAQAGEPAPSLLENRAAPTNPAAIPTTAPPTKPENQNPSTPPTAEIPSYLRELRLGDGRRLSLNGIAFSAQPIALLNGRAVGVGESVEGFTVTAIDRDQVTLRGAEGPFLIRLK